MKTTPQDLFTFIREAQQFLNVKDVKETKLMYAVRKTLKKAERTYSRLYEEPLEDERMNLCEADEKGVIIRDDRGMMKFTKENLAKLTKKQRDLMFSEVEIDSHTVSANGTTLTPMQLEAFSGFVLEDVEPQS